MFATLAVAIPLLVSIMSSVSAQNPVVIDFNGKSVPTSPMPFFSVGADRAAIFLRDEHQRDLVSLQKSLHFKHLRCHGIFNEEMKVVTRDGDGKLVFNWKNVDEFIERQKAVGIRPFVELGYMPEPMASGKDTCFWYRGNTTPPKSQAEWAELVEAFVRHEVARFGLADVRKWFFEVWNEPNLDYFWRGTREQYFELYETSARAVKKVDAKLKVGGPSTAGLGWIPEFLAFCKKNDVPVDFVSTHHYGATEGFVDAEGRGKTILDRAPDSLYAAMEGARKQIRESATPKLPLYITEWGPSYSQADPIHDNYICAAWVLDKLAKSAPNVDGMSYWAFSDQFEEGGPVHRPFTGGFGLLNYDGLRKPGFFSYLFLSKLQKTTYPTSDVRVIASKSGDRVSIVTWDYTEPPLTEPNNPYFHRDLSPKALPDKVLNLRGLAPGTYRVQRTCAGYLRNDVYGAYMALGSPKGDGPHLSEHVLTKLRAATTGAPERQPDVVVGQDGCVEIRLPMRTNDAWLVELRKV